MTDCGEEKKQDDISNRGSNLHYIDLNPSMDVKEFAVAFMIAITEVADPAIDLVAKKGKHSPFSVLQGIYPKASKCIKFLGRQY